MAANRPMMATTIMISTSVKPAAPHGHDAEALLQPVFGGAGLQPGIVKHSHVILLSRTGTDRTSTGTEKEVAGRCRTAPGPAFPLVAGRPHRLLILSREVGQSIVIANHIATLPYFTSIVAARFHTRRTISQLTDEELRGRGDVGPGVDVGERSGARPFWRLSGSLRDQNQMPRCP